VIFALDANGYPAAPDTTAYEGVVVVGPKALTITDPESRDIVHAGGDGVLQRDILPPDTPISGELRAATINDTLDALLGDDLGYTVGEMKLFPIGSDNRGEEDQVAIVAFRQAIDDDVDGGQYGKRYWEGRIFPKCYVLAREGGFEGTPEERAYNVRPLYVTKHLWGTALAAGTEGCSLFQGERIVSEYKPKVVAFKGDGSQVTFVLPTGYPAQSTDKIEWFNASSGYQFTAGYTARTTDVVFSSAPASGNIIVALYEYA
jgi:hypothetical protein